MAVAQSDLRSAAQRATIHKRVTPELGQATAFLCHSHNDRVLAQGLQTLLHETGMDLYIDWQDASMPDQPTRETAEKLQHRIVASAWFIFLATSNSMTSRWCPWELGYADGKKPIEHIAVVQTRDSAGQYHGNEYLHLYRRIDVTADGSLAAFAPFAGSGTYVRDLS